MEVGLSTPFGFPPVWKLDQSKKPQDEKAFFDALRLLENNLKVNQSFGDGERRKSYKVYFDLLEITDISGVSSSVLVTCPKLLSLWGKVFLQSGTEKVLIPKNLLAEQSDKFKRELSWGMTESTTGIIDLSDLSDPDLSSENFASFAGFLKTGTVQLNEDNVLSLLHLAEKHFVLGLVRHCAAFLSNNLDVSLFRMIPSQKDFLHSHTLYCLWLQFVTNHDLEPGDWIISHLKFSGLAQIAKKLKECGITFSFDSGMRLATVPVSSSAQSWKVLEALDQHLPIESLSISDRMDQVIDIDLTGSFHSLIKVELKGLNHLETFITPQATCVHCTDCNVLKSLQAPVAKKIRLSNCPALTNIDAPIVEDFHYGNSLIAHSLIAACKSGDIAEINKCVVLLHKCDRWEWCQGDQQHKADLLHGAFLAKNKALLYDVIHRTFLGRTEFHAVGAFYDFTGIENWIASAAIEFSREKEGDIKDKMIKLISFLTTIVEKERLVPLFIEAMQRLHAEDRKKSFILLIRCLRCWDFGTEEFSFIFDLIKHFDFFQDPDICHTFVSRVLEAKDNYVYAQKKLQAFRSTPAEDPLFPLVVRYLTDISVEQQGEIFTLFDVALNRIQSPVLTSMCMEVMERLDLHHLLPYDLDCSALLQKVSSPESVQGRGNVLITSGDTTFAIPTFLIQTRAPRLLTTLQTKEHPKEVMEELLLCIANPTRPLDQLPLQILAKLYQIAYDIGLGAFLYNAEKEFLTTVWPLDEQNISSLLEVYRYARGSFKNDFKNRLLAHACELFENKQHVFWSIAEKNRDIARHIVETMRAHDPLSFEMVQVNHVLSLQLSFEKMQENRRLQFPGFFKARPVKIDDDHSYKHSCYLSSDFVHVLCALVPEATKMDLTHVTLGENTLSAIAEKFPRLVSMTIEVSDENEFVHLRRLSYLKELTFAGSKKVTRRHFEIIEWLPLEKLVLPVHDLEALRFMNGRFLQTLKSLRYPPGEVVPGLSSSEFVHFLSFVPMLEELVLDCFEVDSYILECIQKHVPHLRSFSAGSFAACFNGAHVVFCRKNRNLEQFSFPSYSSIEMIPKFTSLQTLRLKGYLNEDGMETIVSCQPHLKTLALCNWKKSFLPHFSLFQDLQSLDLSKSDLISFDDMVQLIRSLPLQTLWLPSRGICKWPSNTIVKLRSLFPYLDMRQTFESE